MPAVVAGGIVRTAAHIDESWIGTHAATVISRATDRPCVVLNDADAAGIAEARFGAARGHRGVVLMVTIGTGVGTALLNDGVLVPNSELGHLERERPARRHVGLRRDRVDEEPLVEAVDAPRSTATSRICTRAVAGAHRDRRRHREARRQVPRPPRPRLRGAHRRARQPRGHRRRRARGDEHVPALTTDRS